MVVYFMDIAYLLPFLLNLLISWFFFFRINFLKIKLIKNFDSNVENYNNLNFNLGYYRLFLVNYILMYFTLYFYKGEESIFFFNSFLINNFIHNLIFSIMTINILFLVSLYFIFKINNYNINLTFILFNIIVTIPLIFITNTMLTFIFILELISCLLFYQFISSKSMFLDKKNIKKINYKNYLNMIFYQYWVNFLSTIVLFYSLSVTYYVLGTTEWFVINFVSEFKDVLNTNSYLLKININIFLVAFFIKLGIAPLQLFKIEVYNGLPYLVIFYYTTFYFLVFFTFLFVLFFKYIPNTLHYISNTVFFIVFFGFIYSLSTMFNQKNIKSFLAYSTIINSLIFLLVFTIKI